MPVWGIETGGAVLDRLRECGGAKGVKDMNKKISIGIAVALIIVTIAATYSVTMTIAMKDFNSLVSDLSERTDMYRSLSEIDQLARENYANEIDEQLLSDSLASGYMAGLNDELSVYMTQSQLAGYERAASGRETGIGVRIMESPYIETGYIYISRVYSDSPAENVGIERGEQIKSINGSSISELGVDNAAELLNSASGTSLALVIVDGDEERQVNVVCGEYTVQTVFSEAVGEVGYIRITGFDANTGSQFANAVEEFAKLNITSLIIDVRNNSSDRFDYAAPVIDQIVPAGTIASATYADGTQSTLYTSDANDISLPVAVLVNENTSGAAELLACDLRDFGKAILIGEKTDGNGTVQELYTLGDGSAIKLTCATILPTNGTSYNGEGLEPDRVIEMSDSDIRYFEALAMADDGQFQQAVSELTGDSDGSGGETESETQAEVESESETAS